LSEEIVEEVEEKLPIDPLDEMSVWTVASEDNKKLASREEIDEEVAKRVEILEVFEKRVPAESEEIRAPPGTISEAVDPLTIGREEEMRREPPDEMNEIFNWESVPPIVVISCLDERETPVPAVDIKRFGIVAAVVTKRSPIVAIGRDSPEIKRVPILATAM